MNNLRAVCENSLHSTNHLILNLEDYEYLTPDQLRSKIRNVLVVLKSLRGGYQKTLKETENDTTGV